MSDPPPAPATYYRPAEVARMLRCSEWWIKEQARNRRIPYAWIGGSYLFTAEHITEIVRRFEVRPTGTAAMASATGPTGRRAVGEAGDKGEPATRLRARVPRRARTATSDAA